MEGFQSKVIAPAMAVRYNFKQLRIQGSTSRLPYSSSYIVSNAIVNQALEKRPNLDSVKQ